MDLNEISTNVEGFLLKVAVTFMPPPAKGKIMISDSLTFYLWHLYTKNLDLPNIYDQILGKLIIIPSASSILEHGYRLLVMLDYIMLSSAIRQLMSKINLNVTLPPKPTHCTIPVICPWRTMCSFLYFNSINRHLPEMDRKLCSSCRTDLLQLIWSTFVGILWVNIGMIEIAPFCCT